MIKKMTDNKIGDPNQAQQMSRDPAAMMKKL